MIRNRTYQWEGEPQAPNAPVGTPPQPNADLAGYNSVEALVAGYRNSGAEAQRLASRVQQLETVMQQQVQQQAPARNGALRPEERLSELGIPVDALDEYVNERMQRAFQPIARGINARTRVIADYPDYQKFESDVSQFINSDPALQQKYNTMFNADPEGAFEYAFLKFGENRRRATPANGDTNGAEAGKRADAQIPSGRSAGGGERVGGGGNEGSDQVAKAFERYQKTGDPTAFAKARLSQIFSPDFFEK